MEEVVKEPLESANTFNLQKGFYSVVSTLHKASSKGRVYYNGFMRRSSHFDKEKQVPLGT